MDNRVLSLAKAEHKYVFRYDSKSGPEIIDEISRLARDPGMDFDWRDAAVLAFQVARREAIDGREAAGKSGQVEPAPRNIPEGPRQTRSEGDEAKDGPTQ